MSFGVNQVVGDYECLGIIGKPRAGLTYKVLNRKTGELESMRALTGVAASDPESVERLLREMRVHARLTHPNLIGFHDAFELDGRLVMTADYVDGPSLAQRCSEAPLSPEEAVGAILQVLYGLEEAHALGIVHRGITADHVILGPDGAVKLGGFDLAKAESDTALTKVGAVIGDPRYVSPEQVAGKPPVDARTDLYSVGVVLYLALTGKAPFDGPTDFDILSAHVSSPPPPPSLLNPAVSPALDAVVLKALQKNRDLRFANVREFAEALTLAVAGRGAAAPSENVAPDPAPPVPSQGRKLRAPAIAALALAVIALLGGIWMVVR